MLDPVLILGLALLAGQRAVVQPWAVVAATLGVGWCWRRGLSAWGVVVVAVAMLAAWGRGRGEIAAFERQRAEVRDALGAPSRCEARAEVVSSPVRKGEAVRWLADLTGLSCEGRLVAASARARLYGTEDGLARGDQLDVVVSVGAIELLRNLDLPDPIPPATRSGALLSGSVVDAQVLARAHGPRAWIDRLRARVRRRIEATYPAEASPLARALVLGEEDLEPADGEAFRRSGLSHLLAVSGTHLVLVVAGLVRALESWLRGVRWVAARGAAGAWAAGLGVPLSLLYADFAGGSGSAWRAALMIAALLAARALGRRGEASRALGLSLVGMALHDPLAAFDLSLLLSAAATLGLLGLSPQLDAWLARRLPAALAAALAPTLAATLACTPLLGAIAPEVPLAGLPANLLAVPIGELAALPVCILHTLLPAPFERGAALLGAGALLAVAAIARRAAAVPGLPLPPLGEAQGVVLVVAVAALVRGRRRGALGCAAAAALLVLEGASIRGGAPRGELRVTALDVGQGDSLLVDFPDGGAMLVDGGGAVGSPLDPGRAVILPTLRARRRTRLEVVALSHPHPDHFLGLASALPSLGVGELWDSGQGEAEGAGPVYAAMLGGLRARGVAVRGPAELCGRPRWFGGARLELLSPCPSFTPFSNANDNSLVLRLQHGRRAVLLVGDAEHAEEAALVAAHGAALSADLLKVGHHGSRTSTGDALLAAVRPSLAVISCGVRNRFGHPHPTTLATLARWGIPWARTDRGGAVLWATDGDRVRVQRAAP